VSCISKEGNIFIEDGHSNTFIDTHWNPQRPGLLSRQSLTSLRLPYLRAPPVPARPEARPRVRWRYRFLGFVCIALHRGISPSFSRCSCNNTKSSFRLQNKLVWFLRRLHNSYEYFISIDMYKYYMYYKHVKEIYQKIANYIFNILYQNANL